MADDPGPPPRRRLGRRRSSAPDGVVAPDVGPLAAAESEPDAVPGPSAEVEARYAAAEVEAAAEASTVAADAGSPVRRRLGRRAVGSQAGSTVTPEPATASPIEPADPSRAWLSLLEDRSPDASICPFLRAVDDGGLTRPPVGSPDASNRCAALPELVPQSLRQQELVCRTAGHVNCPRYLRGAVAAAEVPPPTVRAGRAITPAVVGSIVVLAIAFSASVLFVLGRGGLDLTAAVTPPPSASAAAVIPSGDPTDGPSLAPAPTASPVPTPTLAPTPTLTLPPTPTPTVAPTPTPAPTPEPTARPQPTSDRYALLRPCPDARRCWIYTVRRGDNLFSIANYFGVSLESIHDRNPWARTRSLRAGQELRLPPPTR